jgi:hypothetical protein
MCILFFCFCHILICCFYYQLFKPSFSNFIRGFCFDTLLFGNGFSQPFHFLFLFFWKPFFLKKKYCCAGWGTLQHLQRFLQRIKYIILQHTPPLLSPIAPTLIPGTISTGLIFAFTYLCKHYLHHVHLPIPFFATYTLLPLPTTVPTTLLTFFIFYFIVFTRTFVGILDKISLR